MIRPQDGKRSGDGGLPQLLLLLSRHLARVQHLLHPPHDEVPLAGQVVCPLEAPVQVILLGVPGHHETSKLTKSILKASENISSFQFLVPGLLGTYCRQKSFFILEYCRHQSVANCEIYPTLILLKSLLTMLSLGECFSLIFDDKQDNILGDKKYDGQQYIVKVKNITLIRQGERQNPRRPENQQEV